MERAQIKKEFRKAYPTQEEYIQAIRKWAPGYDLGTDYFVAKEVAVDNWWDNQDPEDRDLVALCYKKNWS